MVNYDNIPEELKNLNQWVSAMDGNKVPMKSWENEAASSTNPETWSDFETALESYNQHYYDYCGFVFADNGYVGIDIDEGYDEDGLMSVLGADIVGKCHSYTEKSRSGRGFHTLLRGTLPFKGKNNLAGVEIYKAARYFIMTGNTLLYREIIENQEAIDYVVEKYFPELINQLAAVPSPAVAHCRMLREVYGPDCKVVFIGPCISKKHEAEVSGAMYAVLLFDEVVEWLRRERIPLNGE